MCYSYIVRRAESALPMSTSRRSNPIVQGAFFGTVRSLFALLVHKVQITRTCCTVCTAALVRTSICPPAVVSCDLYTRRGCGIVRPLERQQAVRIRTHNKLRPYSVSVAQGEGSLSWIARLMHAKAVYILSAIGAECGERPYGSRRGRYLGSRSACRIPGVTLRKIPRITPWETQQPQ